MPIPRPCALALLLLVLLLSACGMTGEPRIVGTLPPPTLRPTLAATARPVALAELPPGGQLFVTHCAACHGAGGRGDGLSVVSGGITGVPDFTDGATFADDTPDTVYDTITRGRLDKMMPPWDGALTDAERRLVADYVLGLAKAQD
jgi:mono/diheme cytochrome c family protein